MSAPEARCASAITAWEGYFPVPTIKRDRNVRPAITKGSENMSPAHSSPHEIHDLDFVAVADERRRVAIALDDRQVVLDGDETRIDLQMFQQLQDRELGAELQGIAVDANSQLT